MKIASFALPIALVCILSLISPKTVSYQQQHNGIMYLNTLTVGTGMIPIDSTLVNETATFVRTNGYASIFWKIESERDLGTEPVMFRLEKHVGQSVVPFDSVTIRNPLGFGHFCLCGPFVIWKPGSYRATGISIASGLPIASAEFMVKE